MTNSIHDKVVKAIENGQVKMRPKWRFVARAVLLAAAAVLTALALIYLVSFAVFTLRQTGTWLAPGFGPRGFLVLLRSTPWLIVTLALFFIFLLETLMKQYAFTYRKPLLYSVIAVIVFAILGSAIVDRTPLHHGLRERARMHQLPVAGGLYRGYGMMRPGGFEAGRIMEKITTGLRVQSPRGELVNVIVTPETKLPTGSEIAVGDDIVIIGEREYGSIRAAAIRKVKGAMMMK